MEYKLYNKDCLLALKEMQDNSVDSIVTDPPYGLSKHSTEEVIKCLKAWISGNVYVPKGKGFMNKEWDAWVPGPEVWKECLRVLKPGGHLLAFAGTRSMDLMSMSIRLAGFELRDSIGYAHDNGGAPLLSWTYGSGFPKSHNIGKAIDKEAGAVREVIREQVDSPSFDPNAKGGGGFQRGAIQVTTAVTEAAKQWVKFGTALKPAWEPIILARKAIEGTIANNVLKWGTGGLNIDGCRIGDSRPPSTGDANKFKSWKEGDGCKRAPSNNSNTCTDMGRWPANVITDGSKAVLSEFPETTSGSIKPHHIRTTSKTKNSFGERAALPETSIGDTGSAARFFYCAKASAKDRDEGLEDFEKQQVGTYAQDEWSRQNMGNTPDVNRVGRANTHPTVKPVELMRYLVRLVTPPGGTVLDLYLGSGSTGKAAMLEGFNFVGCELSEEYMKIAEARIKKAMLDYKNPQKQQPKPKKKSEAKKEVAPVSGFDFE